MSENSFQLLNYIFIYLEKLSNRYIYVKHLIKNEIKKYIHYITNFPKDIFMSIKNEIKEVLHI